MADASSKSRIPIALGISIAFLVVQDTLNTIFGVQGPVTVLIAAALAVVGLATFRQDRTAIASHAVPIPMQLFVVWATVRFAMNPSQAGFQNLLVWFIFPATIGVIYARSEPGTFARAYPLWKWASVIAALLYVVEVARGGIGAGDFPYSARGAGWLCVLALVVVIPITASRKLSWWPTILLFLAIALSLSRTPLAIAAVLLVIVVALRPFKKARPAASRVAMRFIGISAVAAFAAFQLVTRVPAIRDRFTEGDGYSVGGIEINSSGRSVLWALTIDQWKQAPWIGHGPGSAEIMISAHFPGWISHPHNEYLRILDDTGIIGMTLWGLGMLLLITRAARAIIRTADVETRSLHIAAMLSVLVVLLGSITDNLTISIYCMMIAGSVIGLSARAVQEFEPAGIAPRATLGRASRTPHPHQL